MNINLIEQVLQDMLRHGGIASSMIVSSDGLPIASAANIPIDDELVGAMVAAMMAVGMRSAKEVLHGTLDHSIIHTNNGYMLLFQINPSILLVITSTAHAKLGMVLLVAKQTLHKLAPQFEL